MIVKVCGMRDSDNIRKVSELHIDYIGMIFWKKSPRYVAMRPIPSGIMPDEVTDSTQDCAMNTPKRVGVFVDEMPQNIITRVVNYHLDVIQLHGHETPTMIRNLRHTLDPDIRQGIQIWKAISLPSTANSHEAVAAYEAYEDIVDAFVFDTKSASMGGSGQQFDWSVLRHYHGSKPFLLSGGIGPDDAEQVLSFSHPRCIGIDLNSRFETAPAVKDVDLLRNFLENIHYSPTTH